MRLCVEWMWKYDRCIRENRQNPLIVWTNEWDIRENIWLNTESSIIEDKGIFIEKCFESILKMYFCFFLVIEKIYNVWTHSIEISKSEDWSISKLYLL